MATRKEWKAILTYIRKHAVKPFRLPVGTPDCPLLGRDNRCMAYPVRPLLCRIQGTVPRMPCPHNPDAPIKTYAQAKRLAEALPLLADAVRLWEPGVYAGAGIIMDTK